jgi:D-alanyl-D-alanine dipeptidase
MAVTRVCADMEQIARIVVMVLLASPAAAEQAMPKGFVDAASVVEGLAVDMRYFGADNFVGDKIDGYEQPRCLLTREAANALAAAQRELAPRGLGLKVFDCYRPARAVAHFVRWARAIDDVRQKEKYYPQVDKRDLFRLGYIASRSGHSRGSTVDLTLVRRDGGQELDMGTPFDFFGEKSWAADRSIGAAAQANRAVLAGAMTQQGFVPYAKEWWHFTLKDEPFPRTYFDFPVR